MLPANSTLTVLLPTLDAVNEALNVPSALVITSLEAVSKVTLIVAPPNGLLNSSTNLPVMFTISPIITSSLGFMLILVLV